MWTSLRCCLLRGREGWRAVILHRQLWHNDRGEAAAFRRDNGWAAPQIKINLQYDTFCKVNLGEWGSADEHVQISASLWHTREHVDSCLKLSCEAISCRMDLKTRTWQEPAPRPTHLKWIDRDGNDHYIVLIRFTFKSLNNSLGQQRYVPSPSINWLFCQHKHFLKNKSQSVTLKQCDPVGRNPFGRCFTVTQGVNNHPTIDDRILQHQICSSVGDTTSCPLWLNTGADS